MSLTSVPGRSAEESWDFSPAIGPSPLFSSPPHAESSVAAPPATAKLSKPLRSSSKSCPFESIRERGSPKVNTPKASLPDHHHKVDSSASISSSGFVYKPLERYFHPSSATRKTTLPSSIS